MITIENPTAQSELIRNAISGDASAVSTIVKYLSSANPTLCQIMQAAIHQYPDPLIWFQLLHSLASRRWSENISLDLPSPAGWERFEQSIFELFIEDKEAGEKNAKENILEQALNGPRPRFQQAAACLAGMRGDIRAIPVLDEIIDSGIADWSLWAVRALGAMKDERCGPPLIKALAMNRGLLHREARRELHNLGVQAKKAWCQALNHPDSHIRWHAARGLGEIGDARAAQLLAAGLYDDNYAVRWASADVIAQMGTRALKATLTALCSQPLNEPFRLAVYHALHGMGSRKTRQRLQPLLNALRGPAPSVEAPAIAQQLLLEWEESE